MKKSSNPARLILQYFLGWRLLLFIIAYLALFLIPRFGAKFPYFDTALEITKVPSWIWGFGNFDGVHYLRIAQDGYSSQYSQAFFPLYPLLIKVFNIFPRNINLDTRIFTDPSYFYTGLILSNLFFLFSLYFFYKLIKLDYKKQVATYSIIFLLAFPTSYYFGSIYSESLFILLAIISIYLARKKKFLYSAVFAAFASATRITGLLLWPLLAIEIYLDWRNQQTKNTFTSLLSLFIAPLGAIVYMVYLNKAYGNTFYFLTSQPAFGAERSATPFILLPQVLFRYTKILLTVPLASLSYFNASLELVFSLVPLAFLLVAIKKIRFSYWLFTLLALLLPTFTGTLSSMPRYALMVFLLIPLVVKMSGKYFRLLILIFLLLQIVLLSLFTRGYWVA